MYYTVEYIMHVYTYGGSKCRREEHLYKTEACLNDRNDRKVFEIIKLEMLQDRA